MRRWFLPCSITSVLILTASISAHAWGFFGHRLINRLAVYTLPPGLVGFYKAHIDYLTDNATRPDSRRTVVPGEAPRHFLDVDVYGNSALHKLPRSYTDAVALLGEDSLLRHGIVPWQVARMKGQLTAAFQAHDADQVLRLSADLGHYIADACVPLHTTHNYNGQLTGQRGIHGLWESRLPELLSNGYDFFTGPAPYLDRPADAIWQAVGRSHAAVDSVLGLEWEVSQQFAEDRKYGFEQRGTQTVRTYSRDFARAYHQRLSGQVERQMRLSVRLVGAFWYTAWVDAGQPDLSTFPRSASEAEQQRLAREAAELKQAPAATVPGHEE
ncbi:zinc dependent phospholipase C family protein [Hymenobacter weizhouensis]|uniref:zinc dependent phospholipase C family protein n=1 Tax=Hymenobacter sp. YIM 151500-1 TaxID=2987689 RepID=UPI002226DE11|nr:zinc dependent phospholipase C family protein [Hymenobacter sp. YIM 151500-1]UYZ62463.1 zinc dependent phospholipase C family protein [Hymenobacter sp. YIM 151500-1]